MLSNLNSALELKFASKFQVRRRWQPIFLIPIRFTV